MRSVIVPLYWLWCGVSVFILVRRRMTGKSLLGGRTESNPSGTDPRSPEAPPFPPLPADTAPSTDAVASASATATRDREPVAVGAASPPTTDDGVGPAADARPQPDRSAAAAARLGVPMSTVDSLAEALEGIALPCDLAPLIGSGNFDPRSLVLVTSGVPDEIVGTSVADEMERLGFTLEPLSDRSVLATNDRASVEIAVYGDAETLDEVGTRRFPTAPSDSVVVDIRLR